MNVSLKPAAQKFIEEQVKTGNFRSPDEVLQEAVDRMMGEVDLRLDDATVAAINRADEQLERGEGIEFDRFAEEMRRRIASR